MSKRHSGAPVIFSRGGDRLPVSNFEGEWGIFYMEPQVLGKDSRGDARLRLMQHVESDGLHPSRLKWLPSPATITMSKEDGLHEVRAHIAFWRCD